MNGMTSKEIRDYVLNIDYDLDELFDYIESDFKNTIDGIFAGLYRLLIRNYNQNESRVNYLIKILDSIIDDLTDEEIKYLNGNIETLNTNIFNNVKKKSRILINEPINKINEIHNKAANKVLNEFKNNKIKVLKYLIFHEKNLSMIEDALRENNNIMNYRNEDGENIFSIVLKNYIYLNEREKKEINYLYNVILLFIDSKYGDEIFNNKSKYTKILTKSKLEYKEHIIKLIELFDKNFRITKEEIEQRYDKQFDFSEVILNEINTFIMDNSKRVNFTNQKCITIDGKDTFCLDDAIYLEENCDGTHTLYIHIADVPSFVPYDSIVNAEARKRIENIYLNEEKISLYPELISERLCSLLPNNNRNVITSIYKLDEKCNLISEIPTIVKGKINVNHKMTYEDVDIRISNPNKSYLDKMLCKLYIFSLAQRKINPDRELYRELENYILFETHHESLKVVHSAGASIVHEVMVLNNCGIAKYFKLMDLPYMYRTFQMPSENFINEQLNKIKALNGNVDKKLMRSLINNFTRANYTNEPIFHKGHNVDCYSHSSSPLRRYSDAYGQYLIYDFIFKEKLDDMTILNWDYRTKELVKYINKTKEENENFARQYNYLARKKLIKK